MTCKIFEPAVSYCKKQTRRAFPPAAMVLLSGCSGIQSTLAPKGPAAQAIADIGWVMFAGATLILLLVMALALYAIYRIPDKRRPVSANVFIFAGGVALPVVALSALLVYGVLSMGYLRAERHEPAVQVEVVGNQWWWDVHYHDPSRGESVTTANEIHIPVGKPVKITLRTNDVIHSFWVPNLAGKIDLVPGRTNHIVLQADQPGTFRGQCAEFCGAQHARMAFLVIAEPAEAFNNWLDRQRMPAATPANAVTTRGREAFLSKGCVQCHTIRGLTTAKENGPDLTHVASRKQISAGTLENNRDNLIALIARSQEIKPGNRMPSFANLDDATLNDIATYLESLQ